jgi:hypothetical protein
METECYRSCTLKSLNLECMEPYLFFVIGLTLMALYIYEIINKNS